MSTTSGDQPSRDYPAAVDQILSADALLTYVRVTLQAFRNGWLQRANPFIVFAVNESEHAARQRALAAANVMEMVLATLAHVERIVAQDGFGLPPRARERLLLEHLVECFNGWARDAVKITATQAACVTQQAHDAYIPTLDAIRLAVQTAESCRPALRRLGAPLGMELDEPGASAPADVLTEDEMADLAALKVRLDAQAAQRAALNTQEKLRLLSYAHWHATRHSIGDGQYATAQLADLAPGLPICERPPLSDRAGEES